MVAESSDDVTKKLYSQIQSTMKQIVSMYNIGSGPQETSVTVSSLGERLVTESPSSPQSLEAVRAVIGNLPKVGGSLILPVEDLIDTDATGVLQHLVFITSKNLTVAQTKGFEAIKEGMRSERIMFNMVNVLSPQYDDEGEVIEQKEQPELAFLIEANGGDRLPGVVSLIGENTMSGLGKLPL